MSAVVRGTDPLDPGVHATDAVEVVELALALDWQPEQRVDLLLTAFRQEPDTITPEEEDQLDARCAQAMAWINTARVTDGCPLVPAGFTFRSMPGGYGVVEH